MFCFLQLWPQTVECSPSLRCLEHLSLLLFDGNSRLFCFQTSDCAIIHLFTLSSVVFCCLSSGKETAPVCGTRVGFPWLSALQIIIFIIMLSMCKIQVQCFVDDFRLDLDAWINQPESDSSDEEETTGVGFFSSIGSDEHRSV